MELDEWLFTDVPAKLPKLGIYLTDELKDKIAELADQERRSMSQMASILLEEAIAAREQNKMNKTSQDRAP